MNDSATRERARQLVGDRMVDLELGPYELARHAGIDAATVGDFINGRRWPQPRSRKRISVALGWVPEGIEMLMRGEEPVLLDGVEPETVGTSSEDAGVLLDMPPEALEGLGPAEREEVITAAKLSALATAREIRRRLGQ